MTSVYLRCDNPACKEIVDRYDLEHTKGDGTFGNMGAIAARRYAVEFKGWRCDKHGDWCPKCKALLLLAVK